MGGLYERGFQTSSLYVGRQAVEQLVEYCIANRNSRVRFSMVSLEIVFYLILPAAL